jgi:hypothetical protein
LFMEPDKRFTVVVKKKAPVQVVSYTNV